MSLAIAVSRALALSVSHRLLFFSHEIEITVTRNDAPENCRTGRRFRSAGTSRSSTPESRVSGYCGAIETNLGHDRLPDDKYDLTLHQSRQTLDRALVEGCRFRGLIAGYGGVFELGDKPRYPIMQMISRILEPLGCEPDG